MPAIAYGEAMLDHPHADPDPGLLRLLEVQRAAAARSPGLAERRDMLDRLAALLHEGRDTLHDAISADYGNRARPETMLAELLPTLAAIRYARRHLPRWMRPRRRHVGLSFQPGSAWVMRQPVGCVGIVSPWNYPLFLSMGPLVDALAAGNRVMLKPSEITPRFGLMIGELLGRRFGEETVAVANGGPETGRAFCALPFDHLLFTGSTGVGRQVMQAAAARLTPVTLELGGKSPVIVCADADIARTAHSLAVGKFFNAGQTCIAPDYVLVPQEKLAAFAGAMVAAAASLYPRIAGNPDYTSIITDRHLARLEGAIAEAERQGTEVMRHPDHEAEIEVARDTRRLVPSFAIAPALDGALMRDEIFGPVLPILPYRSLDEAIAFVNARPRPLAFYCYTDDRQLERRLLARTISGGATVNGTLLHCAQPDLPFGGIGPSGMERITGKPDSCGFRTSAGSTARTVQRLHDDGAAAWPDDPGPPAADDRQEAPGVRYSPGSARSGRFAPTAGTRGRCFRLFLFHRRRFGLRTGAILTAEADLAGKGRAPFGIARCDHRIIRRQAPAFAILFRRHGIGTLQMPFEHLELLSVFKADDVVGENRPLDRHRRLQLLGLGHDLTDARESLIDLTDQGRQSFCRNGIVGHMGRDDLRREREYCLAFFFCHVSIQILVGNTFLLHGEAVANGQPIRETLIDFMRRSVAVKAEPSPTAAADPAGPVSAGPTLVDVGCIAGSGPRASDPAAPAAVAG